MEATFRNFKFTDEDVVNPDAYIPKGEYNPHNVHPFLIHNEYGTLAVVFADCEQDALDEAADAGKLKGHALSNEDVEEWNKDGREEDITYLGNASEPYSLDYIGIVPLPNPPFSCCAMFEAMLK